MDVTVSVCKYSETWLSQDIKRKSEKTNVLVIYRGMLSSCLVITYLA